MARLYENVRADGIGPEELLSGSDGVIAALIDTTYSGAFDRRLEGESDLRCKIQLAGKSRYSFDGTCSESPATPRVLYAYKPVGSCKDEHIEAGVHERSITLVFPISEGAIGACERNDVCVESALRLMGGSLLSRDCPMPAAVARLVTSILDADRATRSFEKLRRCRLDELACLALDLFLDTFQDDPRWSLTPRERRQVHDARDILFGDLRSAPSLSKLAALVGSNRTKLGSGFRVVFGMSPYNLLHQERMRVARELLEEGKLTVTDVSGRCGYEHISNFSLAFKAFHGIAPSLLRGAASAA